MNGGAVLAPRSYVEALEREQRAIAHRNFRQASKTLRAIADEVQQNWYDLDSAKQDEIVKVHGMLREFMANGAKSVKGMSPWDWVLVFCNVINDLASEDRPVLAFAQAYSDLNVAMGRILDEEKAYQKNVDAIVATDEYRAAVAVGEAQIAAGQSMTFSPAEFRSRYLLS